MLTLGLTDVPSYPIPLFLHARSLRREDAPPYNSLRIPPQGLRRPH